MGLQENMAAFIREIMRRNGKTLTEFSEELGISRNSLYAYCTGGGNPTMTTLEHMAERLNVNPASLILGVFDLEQGRIANLLLDTVQSVSELPEEKRLRFAELFLEIIRLWDEG